MIGLNESFQSPSNSPLFAEGEIIHHKRYDYRGVIVGIDFICEAEDGWYQTNQTQPDRNQPWYHVMVDGSDSTTYVAESNLEPDTLGQAIDHPLIGAFFSSFESGSYIRNDEPWPG
jgi:heat shock protein HspQ